MARSGHADQECHVLFRGRVSLQTHGPEQSERSSKCKCCSTGLAGHDSSQYLQRMSESFDQPIRQTPEPRVQSDLAAGQNDTKKSTIKRRRLNLFPHEFDTQIVRASRRALALGPEQRKLQKGERKLTDGSKSSKWFVVLVQG